MILLKDQRYRAIKSLIESNGINSLKEVFTILPFTVVRRDLKINYNTLRRRVDNSDDLTIKNIIDLAALFEVDPGKVFHLALKDVSSKYKAKKKLR